jgi:glycosyltransferase involved in cell wall biosynthesis
MDDIQLSICICTLNRARLLRETLENILAQKLDGVEIVVVDNSPNTETEAVINDLSPRFPRLSYNRVDARLGFDEKYCTCVELARGRYVWTFSDDDLLKPGAVEAVLEATRQNHSLIIVNGEARDPDLAVLLNDRRFTVPAADRVYAPTSPERDQLFADIGRYSTFIPAVVMRRADWLAREQKKYFQTMFVHVGVLFQSPLPGTALVITHPWIIVRYGNHLWKPQAFRIWMFDFPELAWSFTHYAEWSRKTVCHRHPWKQWELLLMARAMGNFSLKDYETWIKPRLGIISLRRLLTWGIAVFPIAPFNLAARFLVKYIFRKSPSITLYDLEAWRRHSCPK